MQVSHSSSQSFLFTAVYGSPNPTRRQNLWANLKDLGGSINEPWILAGDFNAILCNEDKRGGSSRRLGGCTLFKEFMDVAGLHDLGFTGPRFTWKRGLLLERLDRAVCNMDWLVKFPKTMIHHLPRIKSDHRPLLVSINTSSSVRHSVKPFRFIRAWLEHQGYLNFIQKTWNPAVDIQENIHTLNIGLKKWNVDVFGHIKTKKRKLLNKLKAIQYALEISTSLSLLETEAHLLQELETTLTNEEDLWNQKSRSKWIQEGDHNTSFFYNSTIARRRGNLITGLKLDGVNLCTDDAILQRAAVSFYKELFSDDNNSNILFEDQRQLPRLNDDCLGLLGGLPSDEEITSALFDMSPWKAPGIDGMQTGVYQRHWSIMRSTVCSFIKKTFREGFFDDELNKTLIVLIPKKSKPDLFGDLRPISVCNVLYKIITKIIANRLKPHMPKLVQPQQTSFVAGKNITENIIIAQEAIHSMSKKTGRFGWMALKVDLEKAYDRLRWDFIEDTLLKFGLPDNVVRLFMFCISSSSFQILWNGSPTDSFRPTRGIRQGDPLSPYIFVLCMERLGHQIEGNCTLDLWKPLTFGSNNLGLSHLFFADDLLLFAQATTTQARMIKHTDRPNYYVFFHYF
ncbi:DNAse I-like superfamily protein [Euphorbia peplus]|nr:DNAse I-like superfamily protein [Euphorbia peplus]